MPQTTTDNAVGRYGERQLYCKERLIAWAQRGRFRLGLELARRYAGKVVLDYGCGDGTFLQMLMAHAERPTTAVGLDINAELIAMCRSRLAGLPGLTFLLAGEMGASHACAYDAVMCMEVLEHVVDWHPLLDDFERLLAPGGELLISVPVETGLPVLVKQSVRWMAGKRGLGDYPGTSSYTWAELGRSVLAGESQHVIRPVFREAQGAFHDHKGFNWRRLRKEVNFRFELLRVVGSPVPWLTPHLASQVWFLARKRRRV